MVFIESKRLCMHISHLFKHNTRTDNKNDGNCKLERYQYFPKRYVDATGLKEPFQYKNRLEGRHEQCRVKAGNNSDYERYQQYWNDNGCMQKNASRKRLAGDFVQPGQQ